MISTGRSSASRYPVVAATAVIFFTPAVAA
jgi:hypothetical protein